MRVSIAPRFRYTEVVGSLSEAEGFDSVLVPTVVDVQPTQTGYINALAVVMDMTLVRPGTAPVQERVVGRGSFDYRDYGHARFEQGFAEATARAVDSAVTSAVTVFGRALASSSGGGRHGPIPRDTAMARPTIDPALGARVAETRLARRVEEIRGQNERLAAALMMMGAVNDAVRLGLRQGMTSGQIAQLQLAALDRQSGVRVVQRCGDNGALLGASFAGCTYVHQGDCDRYTGGCASFRTQLSTCDSDRRMIHGERRVPVFMSGSGWGCAYPLGATINSGP